MNEVTIPLKISGIAQMKAELRELKGEIANATDPAQMTALAQRAGEVADRLKDANEQVAVFTAGSKFESISNSLAGVGGDLASLDFEGASDKAKVFAKNLGSLKPADISKGFKDFTGTLGILSKAFVKLGLTILMNPIFLIVAAVVAIIAVIAIVLNKFGLLDGVIKALMAPINALIAGFKAMTDWLGITAFAAEDNAARTLAANEKVKKSSEERTAIVTADLGREIAEAKAAGKDTTKLEEERSNVQIKEANNRKKTAIDAIEGQKALGKNADKEKLEELRKQVIAENEIIKQGYSDKRVAQNTANKADADAAAAAAKAAGEKFRAADKASLDQIAAARKIVTDSTKTAQQIEIDNLNEAYAKKIADATKYKNDTKVLTEAQAIEIAAINKKYTDEANAKIDADNIANNEKRIAYENAAFLETQRLTLSETEFKKLQATQAAEAKMDVFYKDAEMVKLLETELAAELVKIQDDADKEKTAKLKEETDKQNKIKEDARQLEIKGIQDNLDTAAAALDSINSLASIGMEAKLKGVKKGSKEEEKILRQQFKQQKAMQLAMAVINGAQSILAITATAVDPTGITTAIRIAATVAATAASIATIAGTQFGGSASAPDAPDVGAGATAAAVAPAGPSLFGQANTGNNISAGGTPSQNITVTAIVSETEMTASQHHVANIQNNSNLGE
jgi:trimeric autotransporter adhesin